MDFASTFFLLVTRPRCCRLRRCWETTPMDAEVLADYTVFSAFLRRIPSLRSRTRRRRGTCMAGRCEQECRLAMALTTPPLEMEEAPLPR